jgi:hypothetical protein
MGKAKDNKWEHTPEIWKLKTGAYDYCVYFKNGWIAEAQWISGLKIGRRRLGKFPTKRGAMQRCRFHQKAKNNELRTALVRLHRATLEVEETKSKLKEAREKLIKAEERLDTAVNLQRKANEQG